MKCNRSDFSVPDQIPSAGKMVEETLDMDKRQMTEMLNQFDGLVHQIPDDHFADVSKKGRRMRGRRRRLPIPSSRGGEMSNTKGALVLFEVVALMLAGCCRHVDVDCENTTAISVRAESENVFPKETFYSLHWTTEERSGIVDSEDAYDFANDSARLRFLTSSLADKSTVEVEFYVNEELIAGPETLAITWKETGTCDNVEGPSWCEGSPILKGSAELVLDADAW